MIPDPDRVKAKLIQLLRSLTQLRVARSKWSEYDPNGNHPSRTLLRRHSAVTSIAVDMPGVAGYAPRGVCRARFGNQFNTAVRCTRSVPERVTGLHLLSFRGTL